MRIPMGVFFLAVALLISPQLAAEELIAEYSPHSTAGGTLLKPTEREWVWTGQSRGGQVKDVATAGQYAYFLIASGIRVYDVHDIHQPEFVTLIPIPEAAWSMAALDNCLCVGTKCSGLLIHDISCPGAPRLVARTAAGPGPIKSITTFGTHVQPEVQSGPYAIIDLTDPTRPVVTGETPWFIEAVGDNGLACASTWPATIEVLDLSHNGQPEVIQTWEIPDWEPQRAVIVGSSIYFDCPHMDGTNTYVIDTEIQVLQKLASPLDVKFEIDGKLFAWNRLLDVSDPFHPLLIPDSGIPGSARMVSEQGRFAAVSDGNMYGILDTTDLNHGSAQGTVEIGRESRDAPRQMIVSDHRVVLDDWEVFDLAADGRADFRGRLAPFGSGPYSIQSAYLNGDYLYGEGFVLDISDTLGM